MKTEERAVQVWHRLVTASIKGETMTYGEVAHQTGASAQSLGFCLRPIQRYCGVRNLPLLSALVVSTQTNKPGSGFGSVEDIESEQGRVYEHDWLRTRTPEPEDLAPYLDQAD